MFAYWGLYIGAALMSFTTAGSTRANRGAWMVFAITLILLVGLRHDVGCDWLAYVWKFRKASTSSFAELWELSDPGYYLLNWLAAELGWQVYGANALCAAIFATGLFVFCRMQPKPWLAVAVAIPYLVVVVAMGYTRQAVALGFVFWGLADLEHRNLRRFLLLLSLATLFHKTAVLMIPMGLLLFGRGWLSRAAAVVLVGVGLWAAFLVEYQDDLWENYVMAEMQSQGASIRIMMNLMPALLLLAFWKRWVAMYPQSRIWFWMALAAIACVPLLPYASTAVDRIALYITPLQVVVLSRLPTLSGDRDTENALMTAILVAYAAVLYIWLNYATHAVCWVPYHNLLFQ